MKSTLLISASLLLNLFSASAQNDPNLYGDWKSADNINYYFSDRSDDDVDFGNVTLKPLGYSDGCTCGSTVIMDFDWITQNGKVKFYNKVSETYMAVNTSCPEGTSEADRKLIKDACQQTSDKALADFKNGHELSMEMPYSINGNTLILGGKQFTSTSPKKAVEQTTVVDVVETKPAESLNGYHVKVLDDGSRYEGEWKDNMKNGQGTFTASDGEKYVGEWKDNYRHGQGTATSSDGSSYTGEYKMGSRDGYGTFVWATGDKYTGDWLNNTRHGTGTITWADDGSSYSGQWENDLMHGNGTYKWATGSSYTGQFQNNQMNGQGTYTSVTGEKTTGEFRDGKFVE